MNPELISIHEVTKTVSEAMNTRHSIREYDPKPIPEEILNRIFETSLRSPSWKNSQPWKVHIVSGAKKELLAEKLTKTAKKSAPTPETSWPESYPSDAKKRMFDLGMKIYGVAGIDRKDKEARDQFMLRNFSFFGAPTAVFITSKFDLNFFVGIDLGCFLQSVLLLAREEGLGTCPQAALGAFPEVVRETLGLANEEKVIMGLSIGYPKADSDLNRYHTPREGSSDLIRFH
ncbi:nitroreductase [Leptospira levettii]|uniref:nitroreductase n=1 Tax=Leptospira levettii TaxID=2023178 RepID=UPI000C2A2C19|nr:nitroreductase [Leptospira levettii]MCW7474386.1 nitroreductase [Leptospira levettii]PJZ38694.1 nitroreductase [Leptospira levettii]PKA02028.1 nitroreductase [Leptospira levettii]